MRRRANNRFQRTALCAAAEPQRWMEYTGSRYSARRVTTNSARRPGEPNVGGPDESGIEIGRRASNIACTRPSRVTCWRRRVTLFVGRTVGCAMVTTKALGLVCC